MSLSINIAANEKAPAESTGSGFEPIPEGNYKATVFDAELKEFGPNSANAGRPFLNIQWRISEGQYTNRRLFDMVPLFATWAPTEKNPDGSDAFAFFRFFALATGKTDKEFRAAYNEVAEGGGGELKLPEIAELFGLEAELRVTKDADVYAFNKAKADNPDAKQEDYSRNNIRGITAVGKASPAKKAAPPRSGFLLNPNK